MAISNAVKAKLNKMCIVAKEGLLGDVIQSLQTSTESVVHGTYTAVADDQTAGTLDIDGGVATATGFIVQVFRSDILLANYDASLVAGVLTIATNSTDYVVTTGDVINYIIY